MNGPAAVLLDTCAVIWLASGEGLPPAACQAIVYAGLNGGVFVSTASAWEIGLLSRPRLGRSPALQCEPDPKTWFARILAGPGMREAPISAAIAIHSSHLPGVLPADTGDPPLIAT